MSPVDGRAADAPGGTDGSTATGSERVRQPKPPAIHLAGVTRCFGDLTAVDHISFDVAHGEIFAFLGPNGAGKSTTIRMLTTLLRPTSGELRLNGCDVTAEQTSARKEFGIVFQDTTVDTELTAYENMELHAVLYGVPRAEIPARIHRLLALVELETREKDYVKVFSGGMVRRLEIARGLLHQPSILFLDEPTIGLDTQTRTLLWDYVRKLNHDTGMTVFFTTHYIEEAEMVATRIAIIDHGKILTIGTYEELKERTKTDSLENAYLALTGREIRDETVEAGAQLRNLVRGARR